ncbi:hypothetical protein TMatcc_000430 [Talaromyces marneffei ATCC 18224]
MCNWLEFLRAQNQTSRNQNNGNQCLYRYIKGHNGEEAKECDDAREEAHGERVTRSDRYLNR